MASSCRGSRDCGGVYDNDGHTHHLIKGWSATARVGSSAFAINAGAETQALSHQLAPKLRVGINGLACYLLRPV
jgi:hypothetical protein